ncbi:UbiA prenyltransferase family [Amylostereum chailletii]|nr:UbiA prenyltransferase family [Amylostereum chailletii]
MVARKTALPPRELAVQTVLFIIWATLGHSAGCVFNDICDLDLDQKVERTRHRPLAAGVISVTGAWLLFVVLIALCSSMLALANPTATFIGISGLLPLTMLYPLMKRWTNWPQAWLGIAINWGFPIAWLTNLPNFDDLAVVYLMMLGLLCWTIVYDTQYACQDRIDDPKAGVKSTALLFGHRVRVVLVGFSLVFIMCLVGAGVLNHQGYVYFVIACGGASVHFVWQLLTWRIEDPSDCATKFKSNGDMGYIVWFALLLDYAIQMHLV